ncbi:MAG: right-handed parallel beta-helix repeat-containing protein [Sedimentisphaerales bacterium]|nr:right-handed parallel beta-helix repeat-containing protein [Sedimentisphaerales bacterium]
MNNKITYCLIVLLLLTSIATAGTTYVPADYLTIEAAIAAASPAGETIIVSDGTYIPPAPDGYDFDDKIITLESASDNPANCIIDCGGNGRAFYFHNSNDNFSSVRGFTITNGDAYYGGAIECDGYSPTITKCIITENSAAYGGAVDCYVASPKIRNCVITNNESYYDGGAIECSSSSSPEIFNCLIKDNNSLNGYGGAIDCYDSSSPLIKNCTILDNTGSSDNGGVYASYASSPTIVNSILWNNGDDINGATVTYSCIEDGDSGTGNIYSDPMFRTGPNGDYYLSQISAGQLADSNCFDAGSDTYAAVYTGSFSTRTDNAEDSGAVDMGYHYPGGAAANSHILTTSVDPTGKPGTLVPATGPHTEFAEVLMTATPGDLNDKIEKWTIDSVDVSDSNSNRVITMDAAHTVSVKFVSQTTYELTTLDLFPNGTLDTYTAQPFPKDTTVNINASPEPGYVVRQWFWGPASTFNINDAGTYTITEPNDPNISGDPTVLPLILDVNDTTVSVEFKINPVTYMLDTDVIGGNGLIDPRRGPQPGGMVVQLIATPDPGYRVKQWTGTDDDGSTALTNTVTMTTDKDVSVEFEPIPQYNLTFNVINSTLGSVSIWPTDGPPFDEGTEVTLLASPDLGSHVEEWTGDADITGPSSKELNTNTVTMDSDKTVTVEFQTDAPPPGRIIDVFGDVELQEAINDLADNDTIKIHPGTYTGIGFNINKNNVTIIGDPEHPENVVIDCDGQFVAYFYAFWLNGSSCTLNGITITKGRTFPGTPQPPTIPIPGTNGASVASTWGCALKVSGNHSIKNCIIKDCIIDLSNVKALDGIPGGDANVGESQNGGHGGNGGSAGGAGIYVASGNPTIENVLVENCRINAGDAGNGASNSYDFDLAIWGSQVGKGGEGGSCFGAGIYVASGNTTFTNVTVKDCDAFAGFGGHGANGATNSNGGNGGRPGKVQGAGISIANSASATLTNCTVTNCRGIGGLGGNGGDAGGTDENATSNPVGGYGGLTTVPAAGQNPLKDYSPNGGGVFCGDSSSVSFAGCTITGNQTYGSISGIGGISGGSVRAEPRKNYRVPSAGSGVFSSDNSSVAFDLCDFKFNQIVYNETLNDPCYLDSLDINDINSISSYAGDYVGGGGLALVSATAALDDCNFIDNMAPIGGGLYGDDSAVQITDSQIYGNTAYSGGGILLLDGFGTTIINNVDIKGNSAGSLSDDAGADTSYALHGTGGGIYIIGTETDMVDVLVTENYARYTGAGICFDGEAAGPSVMKNCLVTKNVSGEFGGGVASIYFAELEIQDCTITENLATDVNSSGGGIFGTYESATSVKDTILWKNYSVNGSQIALQDGGPFTDMPADLIITYSDIYLSTISATDILTSGQGSNTTSSSSPLIVDSSTIYNQISSTGSANVIVTIDEPDTTVNWSSPASVNTMRSGIATLQTQVLSTFSTGEFTLRHQLENAAVFSGEVTQAGLNKLLANPNVAHIEPVRTVYTALAQGIPLMNASNPTRVEGYDGTGISIAIVDSGVDYNHPMLGGGSFPNSKVIGGYDTGDNDDNPIPPPSELDAHAAHGTACAGIAAGPEGTVGDYIGGVAYGATIYALKAVADDGTFTTDATDAAWDWCLSHYNDDPANPIRIISNSWASSNFATDDSSAADDFSPAATELVQKLVNAGITILASSGNDGYTDRICWPAAMSNIISVGAVYDADLGIIGFEICTDSETAPDKVTCYSNTAGILDILAPSNNAYTLDIVGTGGYSSGNYEPYFGGTSAACPYAAGAVAALQDASKQLLGAYLSPSEIRNILVTSGKLISDPRVSITKPRINLDAAISMLGQSTPIYIDSGCILTGVELDGDTWIVSPGRYNISDNPHFVSEDSDFAPGYYYLSHPQAGQDYNSPCFDIGSDTAANLGLDTYTTRTDSLNDSGKVDLGYHYAQGLPSHQLVVSIDTIGTATGTLASPWTPGTYTVYEGKTVHLEAIPGPNSIVSKWTIDGDDIITNDPCRSVTMDSDHDVKVTFDFVVPNVPKNIIVPDEYSTIKEAIEAAGDGDTIYVYRKPSGLPYTINYGSSPDGLDFNGKAIRIRSENPDDPGIVATTVIDCQGGGRAFILDNGEDANSIIEGFTIINASVAGAIATSIYEDPCDPNVFHGTDATGNGYGGAIYCGANTSPVIRNCIFYNCEVTGGRGRNGIDGYDLEDESDSRPRGGNGGDGGNGYGNGYGGAIYCGPNSGLTISGCKIEGCSASGGIGGDGGNGGDGTSSKLGGDGGNGGIGHGQGFGAAYYCAAGAKPEITDCEFSDNSATSGIGGDGGLQGLGNIPTTPPFAQDGYDGPSIGTGIGGAGYYNENTDANISNCSFNNNTAASDGSRQYESGGGGIYFEPDCNSVKISNSTLFANRVTGGAGGAVNLGAGSDANFINCTFGGNTAYDYDSDEEDGGGDGGALIIGTQGNADKCNIQIRNCTFINNTAREKGGAIIARNFDADFVDCYINKNTAASGGGLYLIASSSVTIHGGTIIENSATGINAEGGGAFISNLPIEIINCQIMKNSSMYNGAGLMLKGQSTTSSLIHNCLFVGNSAVMRGGALFISLNSSPTVSSCTFSDNETEAGGMGGGIFCTYNCSPAIKDCIFDTTKRIAVYTNDNTSNPNISYCMFYANYDGDFYDYLNDRLYKTYQPYDQPLAVSELKELNKVHDPNNNVRGRHFYDFEERYMFRDGPLGSYYLSQTLAAYPNDTDCEAINAGSALAASVNVLSSQTMADYTTRRDSNDTNPNAGDAGQLDIGYHYIDPYNSSLQKFTLTLDVPGGHGTIVPNPDTDADPNTAGNQYYAGTIVYLTAEADVGWRIGEWEGTDDDSSIGTTNYVVMTSDRAVTATFEQPRNLHVPAAYSSLQEAINDAKEKDTIILAPGTYYGSETNHDATKIIIAGRNFTITSTNPDDPAIVAQTVINRNGFLISNVNNNMVIDGITIQNAHYWPGMDIDCGRPESHSFSGDGRNGEGLFGGAIRLTSASPIIRNCRFVDCSSAGQEGCEGSGDIGDGGWAGFARGGAVGIGLSSNPIFKNCQFIDCYVLPSNGMDGGGTDGHGGNWGDPNKTTGGNGGWDFAPTEGYQLPGYYSGHGGAVYCEGSSNSTFYNCLFQGNRAYGGVCGLSGTDNPGGYPSEHYAIDSFGGAVYMAPGSLAEFTNCDFIDNQADTRNQLVDVNVVYTDIGGHGNDNVTDEFVLYDEVVSYGGAVCVEGSAIPVFKNCTFTNNIACAGGAMYWDDSTGHIRESSFIDNLAMLGGGILATDSNSIFFKCDFSYNIATDPVGQGGAIYSASSNSKFYGCHISDNLASNSGGGAYFTGELDPNMHNCLITDNIALRDGGGISANWYTYLTVSNCTVVKNETIGIGSTEDFGGGLSCAYEAYTNIIDSIFWNNLSTEYGSQISIGSSFDASDKRRAEVKVSYSDIKDGASDIYVDYANDCVLDWNDMSNLTGTSLESPLFVEGQWGGYYLSQTAAGDPCQTVDSPCVDSGSATALEKHMYRHTTRTDHTIDGTDPLAGPNDIRVDMGYHYILTQEILGDFNFDGRVDINDVPLFNEWWMQTDCVFPYFCNDRDLNQDGQVNNEDFSIFANNWRETEQNPPEPDPMTWKTTPRSSGDTSVTMTATKAIDTAGSEVKYFFECMSPGCHDSGWQTSSTYEDTGLTIGEQYGYHVRATDVRPGGSYNPNNPDDPNIGNKTGWSIIAYAVAGEDTNPPMPNPMEWAVDGEPCGVSSTSVDMTAADANDTSGVEYYFDCISDGCHDSGWQDSSYYEDTGLTPATTYTYQVRARDKSANQNETELSSPASATTPTEGGPTPTPTPAPDTTPPTYTPTVTGMWVSPPQTTQIGSYWYHVMESVVGTDAESPPVSYYFECTDGGGTSFTSSSPVYQAGPYLGHNYSAYRVHIRDALGNEVISAKYDTYGSFIEN